MRIAIVSDTHNNIKNFNKAINWLNKEKIKLILHCGDITSQETINEANRNFQGEIKFVRGNGDFELDNVPEEMEIELGGNPSKRLRARRIFFNHYPDVAKTAAESGKYDMVFYGHTHRPWLDRRSFSEGGEEKECLLVNPGEMAGQRFKPTFAIYNIQTDNLELKILEKL